jgi:tRNA-2-methylthio-N6-dimethylallyladenosine synthase
MAECASVCEHLHLPLQAGSDRTLARMHRGYTAERYLRRLADARAAIPDLAVTTDLIVGFPGETEADFARTLEVVDAAGYDAAYTFVFSPRPGTPAADMTDDFVAPEVAQERTHRVGARGGPVQERRRDVVGADPPEQAGPFLSRSGLSGT